ncbi:hypothetical protein V6N13_097600 [Hibiscus sabdariffa]
MECEDQSNQRPLLPYKDIVSGGNGTSPDICPKNKVPSNDCPMNRETVQVVPAPVEAPAPVDPYGPWMLVEKRRRNSRTLSIVNPVTTVDPNIAPVVNPLFEPTNAPPVTLPLIQESNLDSSSNVNNPAINNQVVNV